jgi:hypothetical protein
MRPPATPSEAVNSAAVIPLRRISAHDAEAIAGNHGPFVCVEAYRRAAEKRREVDAADTATFEATARTLERIQREVHPWCPAVTLVAAIDNAGDVVRAATHGGASMVTALSILNDPLARSRDGLDWLAPTLSEDRFKCLTASNAGLHILFTALAAQAYWCGLLVRDGGLYAEGRALLGRLRALGDALATADPATDWPAIRSEWRAVLDALTAGGWHPSVLLAEALAGPQAGAQDIAALVCRIDGSAVPNPAYGLDALADPERGD